jgi:hypothetical protein
MASPCGDPKCRSYQLTVSEFRSLGGERWDQSFQVRLSLRATKLHRELYKKKPKQVRDPVWPGYRNKVSKYPCGILEQALREIKAEPEQPRHPSGLTAYQRKITR